MKVDIAPAGRFTLGWLGDFYHTRYTGEAEVSGVGTSSVSIQGTGPLTKHVAPAWRRLVFWLLHRWFV